MMTINQISGMTPGEPISGGPSRKHAGVRAGGGRHMRARQFRIGRLTFGASALTVALLATIGILTASGATTGALWNKQASVADPVVVEAGDLDLGKCGFSWRETTVPMSVASGNDYESLVDGAFRFMPGDTLELTQCVELKLDGDNLAVNLKVNWAGSGSPDLAALGIDSAEYVVEPVGDGAGVWRTESILTSIGDPVTVVEPATSQANVSPPFAPATAQVRTVRWDIVMTVSYSDLASQRPFDFPPVVSPMSAPTTRAEAVVIPQIIISAEQTRTGGGF